MTLVDQLRNLFRVDAQIRGLRSRVDAAERYLAAQNRLLRELEDRNHELQQRRRQLKATIANLESEGDALDERINELRERLNVAPNNKQYAALLDEVNAGKGQRSKLDASILSEMERVETLDAEAVELEGQIAERKKVRDHAATELEDRASQVRERLNELNAEREQAAAVIPDAQLNVFDELADRYEGEAMAAIEEMDRRNREYNCGACNMMLPFEHVSVVISGGERVMQCTACQRILFLADESRDELAKR